MKHHAKCEGFGFKVKDTCPCWLLNEGLVLPKLSNVELYANDLYKALVDLLEVVNVRIDDPRIKQFDAARAAIAKAR